MAISKDLFLAILAMDSYNRGYDAGIDGLSESSDGTVKIGTAVVCKNLSDADLDEAAQAAGFYAVAYTVGEGVQGLDAGTTVISYRGTRRRDARSAGRPFGHATAARAQSGMCRNMMQPCGRRVG